MGAFLNWIWSSIGQLFFDGWGTANVLALIRALLISAERQTAVTPVLQALAEESSRGWGRRIELLSDELLRGTPIAEALDSIPHLIPEEALATIRIGSESGVLAQGLREAQEYVTRQADRKSVQPGGLFVYLAALTLCVTTVVSFIVIWIVPKFKAIFDGFDLEFPPMTKFVLNVFDGIANYWYLIVLPPFALFVMLFVFGGFLSELMRQGVFWRPRSWLSMIFPRIHSPLVLRGLGMGIDAGVPFPNALTTVAASTRDRYLPIQLAWVSSEISAGHHPIEALYRARFITRREMTLFIAAHEVGNLGGVMRQRAIMIEQLTSNRILSVSQALRFIFILAFAFVIGIIVVGLFQPIVRLVDMLS